MRVVIAPDKFKDCLTAQEVADAMVAGVRLADSLAEIECCPIADGGEGTVAALVSATGGKLLTRRVTGPLPEMKVDATFGILGDGETAVIEMAAASGLALLRPEDRDPLATTTFGTGELLQEAVRLGARKIILGIGGSATCDAGIGCAQACGFTVLTRDGDPVSPTEPLCGRDLAHVLTVKRGRGEVTNGVQITVACDVTNPLFGPDGAAPVYGPQKGASPSTVAWLDEQLRALAARMGCLDIATTAGAGAAGGLGFGMMAYFGAALRRGIDIVLETTNLRDHLRNADLCLTGEGRFDSQSLSGKAVAGVARACKEAGVPCVVLAGCIEGGASESFRSHGIAAVFSILDAPMSLESAMKHAPELIQRISRNVIYLASPQRS